MLLKMGELYAGEHITFNSTKTKLMHFTINNESSGSIQFMRNKLNVITKCTLLGVEILNNCSADIDHSLDGYASQLWDYEDKLIERYDVAWRKAMRKVWKFPNLNHCN